MPDLSQTDLTQEIQDQLELFQKGTEHVKLLRAAMAGKGIHAFNRERRLDLVDSFRIEMPKHKVVKFVPASGAATRMFRKIYTWVAAPPSNRKEINKFFKEISRFAFFDADSNFPKSSFRFCSNVCIPLNSSSAYFKRM